VGAKSAMSSTPGKPDPFNLGDILSERFTPPPKLEGLADLIQEIVRVRSPEPPLPPPPIQGQWFKDQTLYIDGYTFVGCRFDRCNLITQWATFTFRSCFISPDCRLYFQGPALKLVRLMMHDLRQKGHLPHVEWTQARDIFPTPNDDGTFTLE